jgi:hypothetical protein
VDRELVGSLHANKPPVVVLVRLDARNFEGIERRLLRRLRRKTGRENDEHTQPHHTGIIIPSADGARL